MKFTIDELTDIREALFSKVESLNKNLATLSDVIKTLEGGGDVYPFASGPPGVRAAQGMYADLRARRDRFQALAELVYDHHE